MDMPFLAYTGSFELAARELAKTPSAIKDYELQDLICRKYGIFLENLTDDEFEWLNRTVNEILNSQLRKEEKDDWRHY